MQKRILRVAYVRIGPPVLGLEFFPLPATEGSVVMMRDPDSPDAPHFARKGDVAFIAPRRNGPHTVFMNDREIERGFRERFQQADNREQGLQALFEHASKGLNPEDGVCLVAVAAPVEPSGLLEPPRQEDVYRLMNQASFLTCSRKNTTPSNVSVASEVLVMLASTARMRRGDQCD